MGVTDDVNERGSVATAHFDSYSYVMETTTELEPCAGAGEYVSKVVRIMDSSLGSPPQAVTLEGLTAHRGTTEAEAIGKAMDEIEERLKDRPR